MAENRQWTDWHLLDSAQEELVEDLALTYHLHIAAEATAARTGMPPMPPFPGEFIASDGLLDPAEFIRICQVRRSHREWNESDNAGKSIGERATAEANWRGNLERGTFKHFACILFA